MPHDMAMKRPHARIIAIVLHDHIPVRLQQLHVSPLRVPAVHDAAIPGAQAFAQHVHVVPVQVHRVCDGCLVFDDEADGGRVAGVVDVPFWVVGVGCVAGVCEEEDGRVVVGAEGDAVDGPEEVAGAVYEGADCEGYGCDRVRGWGYGVDGRGGG